VYVHVFRVITYNYTCGPNDFQLWFSACSVCIFHEVPVYHYKFPSVVVKRIRIIIFVIETASKHELTVIACWFVTVAGGFAAFCARHPQLCAGSRRPDATTMTGVDEDVTTGAPRSGCAESGAEQLVTPSDNVLLGHVGDQVTTS